MRAWLKGTPDQHIVLANTVFWAGEQQPPPLSGAYTHTATSWISAATPPLRRALRCWPGCAAKWWWRPSAMIAMIAVTPLLPFAALLAALGFNFTLLCNVPNARAARLGYLAASCTAALALGPRAVAASSVSCRSLCVQQAGALFAFVMRVLEYSLVQVGAARPPRLACMSSCVSLCLP